MTIALWIIAICEVIRAIQNAIQLAGMMKNNGLYKNATDEFVKTLKQTQTEKEFVWNVLEALEKEAQDGSD